MLVTALVTSAIAYAENSLGQIYKVRQDGQYRDGPYNYMENGLPWKGLGRALAVIFAIFATIGVPFLVTGPSAKNIAMAFQNSFGVAPIISGAVVAVLLFLVISGGVRRIAKFSTIIVPFMTIGYLLITIVVLVTHASAIPSTITMMLGSAFNTHAVFGGMLGGVFSYGVKRGVNSSGSGFGETPPSAAAAECAHPATQGLVNAFSVYIDVAVCFCSGIMALVTDCFNVLGPDGVSYMHVGAGSAQMAEQAATNTAGVVWVQEAANTVIPTVGGAFIAIALTCFAYSTCIAYYYEGESGLAYLFRNISQDARNKLIWVIRIVMPLMFVLWSVLDAGTVWAISEIMFGLMNCKVDVMVHMIPGTFLAFYPGPIVLCPPTPEAAEIFGHIGKTVSVESRWQAAVFGAITGCFAPVFAVLDRLIDWAASQGAPEDAATEYITSLFAAVTQEACGKDRAGVHTMATVSTPGGSTCRR